MHISSIQRLTMTICAVALVISPFLTSKAESFSVVKHTSFGQRSTTVAKREGALKSSSLKMAWSIHPPNFNTSFGTSQFGSWYNEVNPTARTIVYDDVPLDYTFVSPGDDWPSADKDSSSKTPERTTRSRRHPLRAIRRAAARAFRGLPGKH